MGWIDTHTAQDGTKSYRVRDRDADGRKLSFGSYPTMRQAKQCKAEVENAALNLGQSVHSGRGGKVTVAMVLDDYLASRVEVRASTRARDESVIRSLVVPYLGSSYVGSLSRPDVQSWVNGLVERGNAPNTISKAKQLLSGALEVAIDDGLVGRNPCRGVKLPRAETSEKPTLTVVELYRLADTVARPYRAMILAAGLAGLRYGEAAGLRRSRVDLLRGTLAIDTQLTKTGTLTPLLKTNSSRATVGLSEAAVQAFREHLSEFEVEHDGLLWLSPNGKPLRYDNWRRRLFDPATEAIGRSEVTFHTLRHSFGAYLQASGLPVQTIQLAMRHSSFATTFGSYGHPPADVYERAAAAVDRAVLDASAPILPLQANTTALEPQRPSQEKVG